MQYYIYKVTNRINGKSYVGQHRVKNEYFRQYMGKGLGIQEALKEYGRHNFVKEILEIVEDDGSRKASSEREKYWIKKLNTMEPNGYNRHPGGIGGCTPESAKKALKTRRKNGYRPSEETKMKISQSNKGKQLSKEHKQHLSDNHHLKTTHVILLENGDKISTTKAMTDIAKEYGTNQNTLIRYSAKKTVCQRHYA